MQRTKSQAILVKSQMVIRPRLSPDMICVVELGYDSCMPISTSLPTLSITLSPTRITSMVAPSGVPEPDCASYAGIYRKQQNSHYQRALIESATTKHNYEYHPCSFIYIIGIVDLVMRQHCVYIKFSCVDWYPETNLCDTLGSTSPKVPM